MKRTILLAGASASGKSTLARALSYHDQRFVVSTSAYLRSLSGLKSSSSADLFDAGRKLDSENPDWLLRLVQNDLRNTPAVVDAIRSLAQDARFTDAVRVNVVCDIDRMNERHAERRTKPMPTPYIFARPDFVWDSSRMSIAVAAQAIGQLAGAGFVDVIVGGQYGSEGKGKLAALLAPGYDALVRSGGPNAGHWVRDREYEYCYHHLPSGTMANRRAMVFIAAGATLWPDTFKQEVADVDAGGRLVVDRNTVLINDADRTAESKLVDIIGSTAQGVGSAQARRILRGLRDPVVTAADDGWFRPFTNDVSLTLERLLVAGSRICIEGTQGSALSIYHGEYPFVTSRDTNVPGLLSEIGVAPNHLRDVWMVVRSMPIRVGGNSGALPQEMTWEDVARHTHQDPALLKSKELTSTTKRQRRVGKFDWSQFCQAVAINRPTRLFLSFADYIDPAAAGLTDFARLPDSVHEFVHKLEVESGCPVAGVSTGRTQAEVCMRRGYL